MTIRQTTLLALLAAGALTGLGGARAQEPKPEKTPGVEPASVWQAGLSKLAGRYTFAQVASPGGLWETFTPAKGGNITRKQVSLNELPPAFGDGLRTAHLTISDLKLPGELHAEERESPSKRGKMRFYEETALGKISLKNLPGIAGLQGDNGSYSGPVEFTLEHSSHSNPSVSGVFFARLMGESTWGAATLDFATLQAHRPSTDPKDDPEPTLRAVLTNARVLRSGYEVFAFVEWEQKEKAGARDYNGSVRLIRSDAPTAPVPGARAGVTR